MRDGVQSAKRQDSVELSQHFSAPTINSALHSAPKFSFFGVLPNMKSDLKIDFHAWW
jgi:hypothetical protein